MEQKICEQLIATVTGLLRLINKDRAAKPRVVAMMCIKRLLTHTSISTDLDLRASALGQWCLRAMRSQLRDLRIAAGFEPSIYEVNAPGKC